MEYSTVRLYRYRLARSGLLLQIGEGWGEIAPLPGFSRETLEEAEAEILAHLKTGAPPNLPSVRFGLTCALEPFSLEPLSVPLCALNTPRKGFTTLKLKLGPLSLEDAIELTRRYVGAYKLRLDFNRAWTPSKVLDFTSHFSPSDFEYLEEPTDDLGALATSFPIASDESQNYSLPIKAAVVKPTIVGSIPKLDVPVVLSSAYESGLGLLQIARRAPVDTLPLGLDTVQSNDLLIPPLKAEEGRLTWNPTGEFPIDLTKLQLVYSG
jgi:O-succinylbenzoate synthase